MYFTLFWKKIAINNKKFILKLFYLTLTDVNIMLMLNDRMRLKIYIFKN